MKDKGTALEQINRLIELNDLGSLINLRMRLYHIKKAIEEEASSLQGKVVEEKPLLDCEYYWIKCFEEEDWCVARWIEGVNRFKMTNGSQIETPYKIGNRIIR